MATSQQLLDKIDTAIENLLDALDDDSVQEYSFGGRMYKRAEFGKTLDSLFKQRDMLSKQVARSNSSPVRVAKLGNPRTTRR